VWAAPLRCHGRLCRRQRTPLPVAQRRQPFLAVHATMASGDTVTG